MMYQEIPYVILLISTLPWWWASASGRPLVDYDPSLIYPDGKEINQLMIWSDMAHWFVFEMSRGLFPGIPVPGMHGAYFAECICFWFQVCGSHKMSF